MAEGEHRDVESDVLDPVEEEDHAKEESRWS